MKLNAIHIKLLFCLAFLVAACGLGSCSHGADEPTQPAGATYVNFRIVVPNNPEARSASRAADGTWGGDYDSDPGDGIDSKIENLTMVVTNTDCNTEVARISDFEITGPLVTPDYSIYYIFKEIDAATAQKLKSSGDTKVHVYTNMGTGLSMTGNTSPNFTNRWGSANSVGSIPMWGVQTVNFSGMKEGETFYIPGEIWLLRAMAKVEITIAKSGANSITRLTSASVTNVRNRGYLLPAKWKTYNDTRDIKFDETINAYTGNRNWITNSNFTPETMGEDAGKKIVFYIPETTGSDSSRRPYITLNYTDGVNNWTNYIYFAEYDAAGQNPVSYNDIVRNHLYRFEVRRDRVLTVNYTVCPWNIYNVDVPPFD